MSILVQMLSQGLSDSAVFLLGALGLTIIYGVMKVVNLAHGEFLMLGAYVMVTLASISPWLGILAAPLIVGVIGYLADVLVVKHFYGRPVSSMLGTFGVGMVIRQAVLVIFGAELALVTVPVSGTVSIGFDQGFPLWRIILIAFAAGTAVVLFILLTKTKFGLRIQTVTADSETASSLGIRPGATSRAAFALGCALSGLAGALAAPFAPVSPSMGQTYLVDAFLIVILAGLGNVKSTVLWSLVIGLSSAALTLAYDPVLAKVIIWSAALCVVATRRRSLVPVRV